MLLRMMWFTAISVVISYGIYLLVGNTLYARASGAYEPILVRDVIGPGSHYLSGMIMVPTPCDELYVRTHAVSSTTFLLSFKTWREPSVSCTEDRTPRPFHATLFGPATGVNFGATLDGVGQPIVVLPAVPIE
ncbi:MAG: hypothetical protein AAB804_02385 [Patescibacteria group bacterium]